MRDAAGNRDGYFAATVLAAIVLIGGSGAGYPTLQAIVAMLSALLLAGVIVCRRAGWRQIRTLEWAVLAILVAVPAIHLIPVPFEWWSRLPGRALPADVLAAAGIRPSSTPLGLDRMGAERGLLALLPGVALFVAGRSLSAEGRSLVVRALLALAAVSACLGAVQVAVGATANAPAFASQHLGQGIGLFVNRNHQAVFLLVAVALAATLLPRGTSKGRLALVVALVALFAAGILATTSRAALTLLPLAALPLFLRSGLDWRARAGIATATVATLGGWAWWAGALPRIVRRLHDEPEMRLAFWRTSWDAMRAHWPVGSGIGSFKAVYPAFEPPTALTPYLVNHAHNDFLELLLEGAAAAAAGLALFAIWYAGRLRAAWRAPRADATAAIAGIAVVLAFSAVDYPLRTLSLTAVFGLLAALSGGSGEIASAERASRRAIGWLVAVALLVVTSIGIIRQLRPHAALLDQRAVTRLALAASAQGDAPRAHALLRSASRLGWRDPATQLWLAADYADAGDFPAAVTRADALMRTGALDAPTRALLRAGAAHPAFAAALAARLATRPPWRRAYLENLADLRREALPAHADLLDRLARTRARAAAAETAAFVSRSVALADVDGAAAAWSAFAQTLLPDGGFARVDSDAAARAGLFGWHRTDLGGLDRLADGSFLLDGSSGMLLYQDVLLPPGGYRFAVTSDEPAGVSGWTMVCRGGARLDRERVVERVGAGQRVTLTVLVPADCPVQRISFHGDGAVPGALRLRLADATIVADGQQQINH